MATTGTNTVGYNLPSDAVWLITGCSSGLGLSLAQLIAAHPTHRVVATARNPSKIKEALPSNSRVLAVALDVTSPSSITSALDTILKHPDFGRVDVLGRSRATYPTPSHHSYPFKEPGPNQIISEQRRPRINGRHRVFSALLPWGAKFLR